jgi:hypothetical protein
MHDRLAAWCRERGLPIGKVVTAITESALVGLAANHAERERVVGELRAKDHAGTGMSSSALIDAMLDKAGAP